MSEENDDAVASGRRSKVGRLVDEYGLEGLPEELARAWQGDGVERRSLRELATWFNERLVRAAMEEAGMSPLDGEAANVYELLSGDEASSGARTRAERRLGREGVDVEQLRTAFVSHQAVHTYLTEVRGVEHSAEPADVEKRVETIQRLVGRTRSVSAGVVEELENADEIAIGEFEVAADVSVTCRDCNSRYELTSFLRDGSCGCE